MKKLILYRGINCLEASAKDNILSNGIIGTEGKMWEFYFRNMVKPFIDNDLSNVPKSDELFLDSESRAIFACGDELSASYYACIHNSGNFPFVIKFQTILDNIYIDGRDFLYTVFQLWDMNSPHNFVKLRHVLSNLYGESILQYFDHCKTEKDHNKRITYCNYACHDNEVKLAHLNNQTMIKGRFGTHFKSTFLVKAPINKEDILDVYTPNYPTIYPGIKLEDVLK